jgi:NDP-sugar pyrophosphorylase family protein
MQPTLLVLAAGMGKRYGGLKQIEPIGPNGAAIIDYSLFDAIRAGFAKAVFVIRQDMADAFHSSVGHRFEKHIPIEYVFQDAQILPDGSTPPPSRTKPWGTGHAVLSAAEAIKEPFAVINADDFYGPASFAAIYEFLKVEQDEHAMVAFVLRNTLSEFGSVARGICEADHKNYLLSIVERISIEKDGRKAHCADEQGSKIVLSGEELVSMNLWGFRPSIFVLLRERMIKFLAANRSNNEAEFFISTALDELISSGLIRIKVLKTHESWFGITRKEDAEAAKRAITERIKRGQYPENLWAGHGH